jgi:hypothetical protein
MNSVTFLQRPSRRQPVRPVLVRREGRYGVPGDAIVELGGGPTLTKRPPHGRDEKTRRPRTKSRLQPMRLTLSRGDLAVLLSVSTTLGTVLGMLALVELSL